MKHYRLIFTRSSEQQIDIPADKVNRVEMYDGAVVVYDNDDNLIVGIPMKDFVGCGTIEVPDPPAPAEQPTE